MMRTEPGAAGSLDGLRGLFVRDTDASVLRRSLPTR
jgi:hypothetical protein